MTLYDVKAVKGDADKAFADSGDADNARQVYKENLMDWIDHYNENLNDEVSSMESRIARRNIANLWIEYCNLEKSLKQFKKAVQVYEDALV